MRTMRSFWGWHGGEKGLLIKRGLIETTGTSQRAYMKGD